MLEDHFRKDLAGKDYPTRDIDAAVVVMCVPLNPKRCLTKLAVHDAWLWNRRYVDYTIAMRHWRPLPEELAGTRLLRVGQGLDSISKELNSGHYLLDHSVVLDLRTQKVPAQIRYFVTVPEQDLGTSTASSSTASVPPPTAPTAPTAPTEEALATTATSSTSTTTPATTEELLNFLRGWLAARQLTLQQ